MDELDLELVNALQHDPRAPWARLAGPLGVDAATLSRRWARLSASGEAWVTSHAGPSQVPFGAFAIVEVGCAPGAHERVVGELVADPYASAVEHTSGDRDLQVTVGTSDVPKLMEYVVDRVAAIDGVTFTRTHLISRLHREASRWRLDSLSQDQRRDLEHEGGADGRGDRRMTEDEVGLMVALAPDGRRPIASLAAELGYSEARVRRMLGAMVSSGRIALRCEAAHRSAGWAVTGTLWLAVPPPLLDGIADGIATMRESRMVGSVAGRANLLANVWVHGMGELMDFQARLVARHPEVRIVDLSVTLRWAKRAGRLLDTKGRSIGCVPADPR